MNGGVSLEPVYIVIMAVAIAVGAVTAVCCYYFNGRGEVSDADEYEEDTDIESDGVPDPVPDIFRDTETEAQKYARQHNMWICEFCETLNPCPEGLTVSGVLTDDFSNAPQRRVSALQGDLANAHRKKLKNAPVCVACGKRQQGNTYVIRREGYVL